jgi:hypothetical protein
VGAPSHFLTKGLKPNYKNLLAISNPTSMEEAIELLLRFEENEGLGETDKTKVEKPIVKIKRE